MVVISGNAQWTPPNRVTTVQQRDGIILKMITGAVRIQACTESIVHVLYSPSTIFPGRTDFVTIQKSWPAVEREQQLDFVLRQRGFVFPIHRHRTRRRAAIRLS